MREIKIKAAYEDIKIGNEVFRIDLTDEGLRRLVVEFEPIMRSVDEVSSALLSDGERLAVSKNLLFKTADALFGENSGERIHRLCGESLYAMSAAVDEAARLFFGKSSVRKLF